MASAQKIFIFCLCYLLSATAILVEAGGRGGRGGRGGHGGHGGSSSGLAQILAAGLVTLLIKDSQKHFFGAHGLGRGAYGHGLILGHDYELGSLRHASNHPLYGPDHDIGGFGFAPSFGDLRYNLGDLESNYPLGDLDLIPDMGKPPIGRDFGLPAPVRDTRNNKHRNNNNAFDPVNEILHRERQRIPVNIELPRNEPQFIPEQHQRFPMVRHQENPNPNHRQ